MTLPDFDDLVLTRMALCWAEVTGIKRAFEEAPETDIDLAELPGTVYTVMGPELQPYPQGQAGSFLWKGQFLSKLLIWPEGITEENGLEGVTVNGVARVYRNYVRQYFVADHPRLSTTTLASLGMAQDLTLQMSGAKAIVGPGGGSYHGIECTFVITMRGLLTQVS